MLIVPAGHPLSGRDQLAVGELDEVPMVLLGPDFCTRRLWEESARSAGIRPRVSVEMNTIGSILAAVRQSASVTVLPAQSLAAEPADGLVAVPLRGPTPRRTVGLLYRRGGYRCAATEAFGSLLRDILGRAGWGLPADERAA
jgi:LysR family cyn operon transcriptional activator